MRSLKQLGVIMIVDLRGEFRRESSNEKREAESLGMKLVLIPGNGWSPPSDKQMAQFFASVAAHPRDTIFLHCWFGGDRSGVFLAAYRIAFEHWTAKEAVSEMLAFHFKSFWHPAMRAYVEEFPDRLATAPVLAPYRDLHQSASFHVSAACQHASLVAGTIHRAPGESSSPAVLAAGS